MFLMRRKIVENMSFCRVFRLLLTLILINFDFTDVSSVKNKKKLVTFYDGRKKKKKKIIQNVTYRLIKFIRKTF